MIRFMNNKKGSVLIDVITALAITAIITVGILAAILYVNSLFDKGDDYQLDKLSSVYADRIGEGGPKEFADNQCKYLVEEGKAKLLGISEEILIDEAGKVVIPETIKDGEDSFQVIEIGEGAFKESLKKLGIREVEIPPTVETIGSEAFMGNDLEKVTIPKSIKSIGRAAFRDNNLVEVELPEELTVISEDAFRNNKIKSISIPDKVVELGESSFEGNQIKDINLGRSIKTIGRNSFANNQLRDVKFPNSLESISSGSFRNNKIARVDIPKGVNISNSAIDGRFSDAYYFTLEEEGTYVREDEILYTWKLIN